MAKNILLLTGNERKKRSFEKTIEGFDIEVEIEKPWIPEIQSEDNADVAAYSAQYGANFLKRPVIKMDSGFFIDGLDGFPGPFVQYVDKQIGADLFFRVLEDLEDRGAHIKNSLAYCEPGGEPVIFSSGCSGRIVEKIKPGSGFIDRLFIADHPNNPNHKTMGEIREEDYEAFLSLWGDAELQFAEWFVKNK
jgi:XTP/dITP diphosphohydrolase